MYYIGRMKIQESLDAMVFRFGLWQTLNRLGVSKTKFKRLYGLGMTGAKDIPVLRELHSYGVWPRPDEYKAWDTPLRRRHLVFSFSWLDENTYPIPGETVTVRGEEYYWPIICAPQGGTLEKWKATIQHDITFAPEALLALAEVFYGLIAQAARAKGKTEWYDDYCLPSVHFWGPETVDLRDMLIMASSILPEQPSLGLMSWFSLMCAGAAFSTREMKYPRPKVWEPYLFFNDANYNPMWDTSGELPVPPYIFAQDGVGHRPETFISRMSPKIIRDQARKLRSFAQAHSAALTSGARPYLELFEKDKYFLWGDTNRIIDIEVPLWKKNVSAGVYLENYGHAAFVLAAYLNREEVRPFNAPVPQGSNQPPAENAPAPQDFLPVFPELRGYPGINWKQRYFARLFWALLVAKDAGVLDIPETNMQTAVATAFARWQKEAFRQWERWGKKNYAIYSGKFRKRY